MYIVFVDLGLVVYVDSEWVIWDFDTKYKILQECKCEPIASSESKVKSQNVQMLSYQMRI